MGTIQPLIQRKAVVLQQDSTAEQAARVMQERRIGCVLVSDGQGHISGIVTKRDLIHRTIASGVDAGVMLSEIMSPHPVWVGENADIEDAVQLMEDHGIRRIPVIQMHTDGTERCTGIVTLDDLIASRSVDYSHLMRIVRSQVLRRLRPSVQVRQLRLVERAETLEARVRLNEFFRSVQLKVGADVPLSEPELEQISMIVLGGFVRRLHHTGAMHLALQLPSPLQESLIELAPGPDHTVSVPRIANELCVAFNWEEAKAYRVLHRFCQATGEWIGRKELELVKAQLPESMRALFSRRRREAKAA